MALSEELFDWVSWDLLSESIARLNLARPFLYSSLSTMNGAQAKVIWKIPRCSMCDKVEDLSHVFWCNSPGEKQTRAECIQSVNMMLSKGDLEYSSGCAP